MKTKYDFYTPFLEKEKAAHVDGTYISKKNNHTVILKDMYRVGLIDGVDEKPFDAYEGTINVVGEWVMDDCVIDMVKFNDLEKIK